MYIADEENASDSSAFHIYLDECNRYQHNRLIDNKNNISMTIL